MHVSFSAVFASVLLYSGPSHNFIAASQVIKFSNSIQTFLLYSYNPMELHLAYNSSIVSHQIVHLPLQFADSAIHTVEFGVVPG